MKEITLLTAVLFCLSILSFAESGGAISDPNPNAIGSGTSKTTKRSKSEGAVSPNSEKEENTVATKKRMRNRPAEGTKVEPDPTE